MELLHINYPQYAPPCSQSAFLAAVYERVLNAHWIVVLGSLQKRSHDRRGLILEDEAQYVSLFGLYRT